MGILARLSDPIGRHGWHHLEFFGYIALVVLMLYFPPRALRQSQLAEFAQKHFTDLMGLYILNIGIALVMVGGVWNISTAGQLGWSLVLAGMGALGFKTSGASPAPPPPIAPPAQQPPVAPDPAQPSSRLPPGVKIST